MKMLNTWFISDTHFGHQNIIKLCRPEFNTMDEMHDAMISRWNSRVKKQDTVFHLGDFAWGIEAAKAVRHKLNGRIVLIVGNHDPIAEYAKSGLFADLRLWMKLQDHKLVLTHMPLHRSQVYDGFVNLHGHVHDKDHGLEPFHLNMSVERTSYAPVRLDCVLQQAAVARSAMKSAKHDLE